MVVLDRGTPERHGRDGVWCDPCLADIIGALNAGGVRTVASCCGHGAAFDPSIAEPNGSIILADGRELVVRADPRQEPSGAAPGGAS
jgi:hypothetical protein